MQLHCRGWEEPLILRVGCPGINLPSSLKDTLGPAGLLWNVLGNLEGALDAIAALSPPETLNNQSLHIRGQTA